MRQFTPEHVQSIIANPFYAIQVTSGLVETHEPSMNDEEWITHNSSLIPKIGAEQWLVILLDVLQGNSTHEVINPYHAINIDPTFAVEHPPILSREKWIQGNVMLIPELGTENWLRLLLNILEGDFVTADDISLGASRSTDQMRFRYVKQKGKKRKKYKK